MKRNRVLAVVVLLCLAGVTGQLLTASSAPAVTPPFSDSGFTFDAVTYPTAVWGDFDNDGDLDALVTGMNSGGTQVTAVYRNNGTSFDAVSNTGLANVDRASIALSDYNHDGNLDVLMVAEGSGGSRQTHLYSGNGDCTFTDTTSPSGIGAAGLSSGSAAWGDYDNDGWPDALVTGFGSSAPHTFLYHNNGDDTFTNASAAGITQPVQDGSSEFVDYNSDGYLDVFLSGCASYTASTCNNAPDYLYENNGDGTFSNVTSGSGLPTGLYDTSAAWGDYDHDGYPDLAIGGLTTAKNPFTALYHNNGDGTFSAQSVTGLPQLVPTERTALSWGEYSNDGNLDLLVIGRDNSWNYETSVFEGDGAGGFIRGDLSDWLPNLNYPAAAWGDYNQDQRLDLFIAGDKTGTGLAGNLYTRGTGTAANTAPGEAPSLDDAYSHYNGSVEELCWYPGYDDQTWDHGLSYNLRVGTTSGGRDIVSPLSLDDGTSQVAAPGAIEAQSWDIYSEETCYYLNRLPAGDYYWSAQAVDSAFATSDYSDEGSFTIDSPTFSFGDSDYSVSEGDKVDVTIERYGSAAGTDTVTVSDSGDGTAIAGSDYTVDPTTTLTFLPGEYEKTISVQAHDDTAAIEDDKTLVLELSSPSLGTELEYPDEAAVTIHDSDRQFAFHDTAYSVDESKAAEIRIDRLGSTAGSDTVDFKMTAETAEAGSDYTDMSRTVVFDPGDANAYVTVPIVNDDVIEPDKTVTLSLENAVAGSGETALVGDPGTVTLTIVDDDRNFSLSASSYSATEGDGTVAVTIKRDGLTTKPDTVDLNVGGGTASAGRDYTDVSRTVTFAAGDSSKTVEIPILEDDLVEPGETVDLSLSNASSPATLASPHAATLTIADNDRSFALSAQSYSVGEADGHATVTIRRSGLGTNSDSVNVATADGSAKASTDYTPRSEQLVFAPGEMSKTISVAITDDSSHEDAESFQILLSSPSAGATIGSPSAATVTIADNDAAPPPTTTTTTQKPPAQPAGKIASARLAKKTFTAVQAKKVKLTVKFSPRSKVLKWAITLKHGKKWLAVKSARKTSPAKTCTMTMKQLFSGKKMKKGVYRLKLSADRNSKTLVFTIK
ncbi:MAG: Calx-beta domain-containing protein [Gaiellaceae bacterium]